ncbi:hypothetical protein [Kosakonia pseudosacchari]|nr:hypothetical protein [Kosakonia pseudosacchari]
MTRLALKPTPTISLRVLASGKRRFSKLFLNPGSNAQVISEHETR